jgi:hypothetical protein
LRAGDAVSPTLIYTVAVSLLALGLLTAVRAVASEARRRRHEEQERMLREHPELLEIAQSNLRL